MLNLRRRVLFIAAFGFALVIFLTLGLFFERISSSDHLPLPWRTMKSSAGAAIYFLIMSGYGFLYALFHILFAQRLTVFARRVIAVVLFSGCFAGFFLLFSDGWSRMQLVMFGVGVISVIAADVVASAAVLRDPRKAG